MNFTDIEIIQHNCSNIYAVFILTNFLEKDYFNQIKEKTEELTMVDSQNYNTNVKANMTSYKELLQHKDYGLFMKKSLQYLNIIYKLRSPHPDQRIRYDFMDLWGMRHKKGNSTLLHTHAQTGWSGAFYFKLPDTTYMNFPDFDTFQQLQENTLYLFPGLIKHSVPKHTHDIDRVSLAFNIDFKAV